jgi:hypothetical protein
MHTAALWAQSSCKDTLRRAVKSRTRGAGCRYRCSGSREEWRRRLQAATRGTMGFTRRLLDAASSADTRGKMERGEHARAWEQARRRGGRLDALVSATKGESLRPSTGRSGRSSLARAGATTTVATAPAPPACLSVSWACVRFPRNSKI